LCLGCVLAKHYKTNATDASQKNTNIKILILQYYIFEDPADVGWVTTNRFWQEGSASGFFPVLTFHRFATSRTWEGTRACWSCQYRRRKNLSTREILRHTKWVGAKPYFTQAADRQGYLMATYNTEYAAYVGGIMQEGGHHRQRKVRPSVNFQARFCPAADEGVPWGEETD
jgi:hypothetical protein